MSVEESVGEQEHLHHAGADSAGHHESPEQRDRKERLGLWLFIGGDAVFLLLEIFAWFYLRALNVDGMWRGAACTKASPCTDGVGNSIISEVPKANPAYTIVIAVLVVAAAVLMVAVERAASRGRDRGPVGGITLLALGAVVAALVVQCYQFLVLPFATVDGAYASTFEFFMGSTLAHVAILGFLIVGVWNRVRLGRYDEGRWHRLRLMRVFSVWIAISVCVLAIVMSLFA